MKTITDTCGTAVLAASQTHFTGLSEVGNNLIQLYSLKYAFYGVVGLVKFLPIYQYQQLTETNKIYVSVEFAVGPMVPTLISQTYLLK